MTKNARFIVLQMLFLHDMPRFYEFVILLASSRWGEELVFECRCHVLLVSKIEILHMNYGVNWDSPSRLMIVGCLRK